MKCAAGVQHYLAAHELGCCSLLAGTCFLVFMALLPLVIDPGLLTFVLHLEPAACLTVHSAALTGTTNCTWTSCQQGCTVDIYKCWHVNVSYLLADPALAAQRLDRQLAASPYSPLAQPPARLYPNVVGCGYPPQLDCDQFFHEYAGASQRTFPCYVSMTDPTVAVVHADRTEAARQLAVGFAPLALCALLCVYVSLRARCRRRHRQTASAASAAARLAEEHARRVIESKRRLDSRKQSWLNAFRQDRVLAAPPARRKSSASDELPVIASISGAVPSDAAVA